MSLINFSPSSRWMSFLFGAPQELTPILDSLVDCISLLYKNFRISFIPWIPTSQLSSVLFWFPILFFFTNHSQPLISHSWFPSFVPDSGSPIRPSPNFPSWFHHLFPISIICSQFLSYIDMWFSLFVFVPILRAQFLVLVPCSVDLLFTPYFAPFYMFHIPCPFDSCYVNEI